MAKIVLTMDTEGEFSRIAFSARTPLFYRLKMFVSRLLGLDYSISTLKKMVAVLKKHKVKCTFYLVGALYLKKGDTMLKEYLSVKPKTSYLFPLSRLASSIPAWGDYIASEMKSDLFEMGAHNFLHESNFVESDAQIDRSLEYTKKAASALGFDVKAYAAPWFELEQEKDPERVYKILQKHGLSTRFDGAQPGDTENIGIKRSVRDPFVRFGVQCVPSAYFVKDGVVDEKEYSTIRKGIEEAIAKNSVYVISTHDTTFVRNGVAHFENVVKILNEYKDKADIITVSELTWDTK